MSQKYSQTSNPPHLHNMDINDMTQIPSNQTKIAFSENKREQQSKKLSQSLSQCDSDADQKIMNSLNKYEQKRYSNLLKSMGIDLKSAHKENKQSPNPQHASHQIKLQMANSSKKQEASQLDTMNVEISQGPQQKLNQSNQSSRLSNQYSQVNFVLQNPNEPNIHRSQSKNQNISLKFDNASFAQSGKTQKLIDKQEEILAEENYQKQMKFQLKLQLEQNLMPPGRNSQKIENEQHNTSKIRNSETLIQNNNLSNRNSQSFIQNNIPLINGSSQTVDQNNHPTNNFPSKVECNNNGNDVNSQQFAQKCKIQDNANRIGESLNPSNISQKISNRFNNTQPIILQRTHQSHQSINCQSQLQQGQFLQNELNSNKYAFSSISNWQLTYEAMQAMYPFNNQQNQNNHQVNNNQNNKNLDAIYENEDSEFHNLNRQQQQNHNSLQLEPIGVTDLNKLSNQAIKIYSQQVFNEQKNIQFNQNESYFNNQLLKNQIQFQSKQNNLQLNEKNQPVTQNHYHNHNNLFGQVVQNQQNQDKIPLMEIQNELRNNDQLIVQNNQSSFRPELMQIQKQPSNIANSIRFSQSDNRSVIHQIKPVTNSQCLKQQKNQNSNLQILKNIAIQIPNSQDKKFQPQGQQNHIKLSNKQQKKIKYNSFSSEISNSSNNNNQYRKSQMVPRKFSQTFNTNGISSVFSRQSAQVKPLNSFRSNASSSQNRKNQQQRQRQTNLQLIQQNADTHKQSAQQKNCFSNRSQKSNNSNNSKSSSSYRYNRFIDTMQPPQLVSLQVIKSNDGKQVRVQRRSRGNDRSSSTCKKSYDDVSQSFMQRIDETPNQQLDQKSIKRSRTQPKSAFLEDQTNQKIQLELQNQVNLDNDNQRHQYEANVSNNLNHQFQNNIDKNNSTINNSNISFQHLQKLSLEINKIQEHYENIQQQYDRISQKLDRISQDQPFNNLRKTNSIVFKSSDNSSNIPSSHNVELNASISKPVELNHLDIEIQTQSINILSPQKSHSRPHNQIQSEHSQMIQLSQRRRQTKQRNLSHGKINMDVMVRNSKSIDEQINIIVQKAGQFIDKTHKISQYQLDQYYYVITEHFKVRGFDLYPINDIGVKLLHDGIFVCSFIKFIKSNRNNSGMIESMLYTDFKDNIGIITNIDFFMRNFKRVKEQRDMFHQNQLAIRIKQNQEKKKIEESNKKRQQENKRRQQENRRRKQQSKRKAKQAQLQSTRQKQIEQFNSKKSQAKQSRKQQIFQNIQQLDQFQNSESQPNHENNLSNLSIANSSQTATINENIDSALIRKSIQSFKQTIQRNQIQEAASQQEGNSFQIDNMTASIPMRNLYEDFPEQKKSSKPARKRVTKKKQKKKQQQIIRPIEQLSTQNDEFAQTLTKVQSKIQSYKKQSEPFKVELTEQAQKNIKEQKASRQKSLQKIIQKSKQKRQKKGILKDSKPAISQQQKKKQSKTMNIDQSYDPELQKTSSNNRKVSQKKQSHESVSPRIQVKQVQTQRQDSQQSLNQKNKEKRVKFTDSTKKPSSKSPRARASTLLIADKKDTIVAVDPKKRLRSRSKK